MRPSSQDEQIPRADDLALDSEKTEGGVKVELKNVSFKYPTRDVAVLNDVNMTVRPFTLCTRGIRY